MAQGPDAEALKRVKGSLYAYEQAMLQSSEFVALILLVTSMEALTVPKAGWRRNRLTKRFIETSLELCSESLLRLMAHANFEEAFGGVRDTKEFLDRLYGARSRPLHSGMVPHEIFDLASIADAASLRVMLISELAREALLSFLRRPFSPLYGHPDIDPGANH